MRLAAGVAMAVALSGCVQATRHSNAIVFGTNTSLGIKVGPNATSVPSIVVGYDRQEAVFLPVVANVESTTDTAGNNLLEPCNPTVAVESSDSTRFAVHPCSLVAINGSAMDSYSVLASFGANFAADGDTTGVGASGGLAQYFATGMAAQLLAVNGGASVVAVGLAAEKSAENPVAAETLERLYGQDSNFAAGRALGTESLSVRDALLEQIRRTDVANLPARITAFEMAIGWTATSLATACTDKTRCLSRASSGYATVLPDKMTEARAALAAWAIP